MSQSGFVLLTPTGRVYGTARAMPQGNPYMAQVGDWNLFLQVEMAPYNYAWLNNVVVYSPAPHPWYVWNGDAWVYEAQAHADFLAYAKASMWEKIRLYRDARSEMGFPANGQWWHNDAISRTRILGLMVMLGGNSFPTGVVYKSMSGELVTLTPQIAQAMFAGAATQDVWMFAVAEQKRMAMEASENPFLYDYTTGWPPVYGE